ncbi:MAG: hypothetical protein P8X96_01950 [Desulfobacteraceae bacterium]
MKPAVILLLCLGTACSILTACGGSADYSDVIEVNEQYIDLLETYVGKLDEAADAPAVADAMHELADGLEVLMPRMKELMGKYPELKDEDQQPERVKALTQKAAEVAKQFVRSMPKVMPYMNDADVREAQARIGAIWKKQ